MVRRRRGRKRKNPGKPPASKVFFGTLVRKLELAFEQRLAESRSRQQLSRQAIQKDFGMLARFQSVVAKAQEEAATAPLRKLERVVGVGEGLKSIFGSHKQLVGKRLAAEKALQEEQFSKKRQELVIQLEIQQKQFSEIVKIIEKDLSFIRRVIERRSK